MYKKASQQALRISTEVGVLPVEKLWDLSLDQLDKIAVQLDEEYKTSNTKSFLVKKSSKNILTKLKFDIVKDILTTKVELSEAAATAREIRTHNAKIDMLIAEAKDGELKGKTPAELEKLRR